MRGHFRYLGHYLAGRPDRSRHGADFARPRVTGLLTGACSNLGVASRSRRRSPSQSPPVCVPVIGHAFFVQPVTTYVVYLLVPLIAWWLSHPSWIVAPCSRRESRGSRGSWRFARPSPLGGSTIRRRVSGLVVAVSPLLRWALSPRGCLPDVASSPLRSGAGSLVAAWCGHCGAASVRGALQFAFQSLGWTSVPYQLFLALPYLLTLSALAGLAGRHAPPAALGGRWAPFLTFAKALEAASAVIVPRRALAEVTEFERVIPISGARSTDTPSLRCRTFTTDPLEDVGWLRHAVDAANAATSTPSRSWRLRFILQASPGYLEALVCRGVTRNDLRAPSPPGAGWRARSVGQPRLLRRGRAGARLAAGNRRSAARQRVDLCR